MALNGVLSPAKWTQMLSTFSSLYKVADFIWPLGGRVNIVMLYLYTNPNQIHLFSPFLVGLSLPLCGISLTLSPWIKILINLSVILPSCSWKGKEGETKEDKGLRYMESCNVHQSNAMDTISLAGPAAMPLSAVSLPLPACSVSQFLCACLCDEPS